MTQTIATIVTTHSTLTSNFLTHINFHNDTVWNIDVSNYLNAWVIDNEIIINSAHHWNRINHSNAENENHKVSAVIDNVNYQSSNKTSDI